MDAIGKALTEITFRIPRRILEVLCSRQRYSWSRTPVDISNILLESVIKPRVLVDCNLVGGAEVLVSLEGISPIQTDQRSYVYHIPKDRTQGRSILSVLGFVYHNPIRNTHLVGSPYLGASSALTVGQTLIDQHANMPLTSNARCQLISENTVLVVDSIVPNPRAALRCVIANDSNLSHLQVRSYRHFSRLVELAVKSFIYNELILEMDAGQLLAGQELGRFRDIVEGYADAEEMYGEYLATNWQRVSFMSDRQTYDRFINSLFGSQR